MHVVKAKFFVRSVTKHGPEGGQVELGAAVRGARNTDWAAATPTGTITMHVNNPGAFGFFESLLVRPGMYPEVDLTFTASHDSAKDHPFEPSPAGHYNAGNCAACGAQEQAHKV